MEQFDYKYEMKKIIIISAVLLFAAFVFSYLFLSRYLGYKWNIHDPLNDFFPINIFSIPFIILGGLVWAANKRNNFTGYTFQMKKRVKEKEKVRLVQYILPFVCIAIGAYIGCAAGYTINEKNRIAQRENEEKTEEKVEDEYEDLGNISVYHENISDHSKIDNEPLNGDYHLFMKSHGGENFYYVGLNYKSERKHLLERGSWTKDGKHFNARYYWNPINCYVNVPSWSTSSSSGSGSTRVIHDDSPRAVQEWVPCPVCGNSGRVGLCQHCNGTGQDLYYTREYRDCPNCGGLKRCPNCGGNGGHYETRYR